MNVKRMVIAAMLISGAVAGLVGLPNLFGVPLPLRLDAPVRARLRRHREALLGRNHPIGIAFGALLFAYLNEQSNPLQILVGVSRTSW